MKNALLSLIIASLLSACAMHQKELMWPDTVPELNYFKDYYAQDKANQNVLSERAYLEWIKKFYLGSTLYSRGWNMMTNELVTSLSNSEDKEISFKKLRQLGKRIAAEWAKDSRHRVINTRHISIWGNALLESIGKKEQLALISKVEKDVDALLKQDIKPKSINAERYYAPSEWDDF